MGWFYYCFYIFKLVKPFNKFPFLFCYNLLIFMHLIKLFAQILVKLIPFDFDNSFAFEFEFEFDLVMIKGN